jgi:hypothetical protein
MRGALLARARYPLSQIISYGETTFVAHIGSAGLVGAPVDVWNVMSFCHFFVFPDMKQIPSTMTHDSDLAGCGLVEVK